MLIGLELTEYYDEGGGTPHYGATIQRLPVHRVTGVYSNGTDATVLVRFVMSDPGLTRLLSNPDHGALELAESAPGDLERADTDGLTVYQGVRALDLGNSTEESLLPVDILGETRTMVFIDSDGQRRDRGVTFMGGYGGDVENPAVILHVASFPEATATTANLRERYGIGPSDEHSRSVGDRPLFYLHGGEFDGAVALFDGSVVLALIPLASQAPDLLADALAAVAQEQ